VEECNAVRSTYIFRVIYFQFCISYLSSWYISIIHRTDQPFIRFKIFFFALCQIYIVSKIAVCLKRKLLDLTDLCIHHVFRVYDWLLLGSVFSCI